MIKFSFVLPISRSDRYTSLCLNSIINQEFKQSEYELIIVLNGEYAKEIFSLVETQLTGTKLQYTIKILPIGNFAYALNYAISLSNGKYVIRIDNDDVNTLDRLKIIESYINLFPNINFFCTNAFFINQDGIIIDLNLHFPAESKFISYYSFLVFNSKIIHPTVVIKKEVFQNYKYSGLNIVEDLDLWLNLYLNNEKFYFIKNKTIYYRISNVQSSRKLITYQYATLTWLKYIFQKFSLFYLLGFFFSYMKYIYKKYFNSKL